ncbi:MAG: zinc ribbon domain-containing protein [Porticoccaceae bacterium]
MPIYGYQCQSCGHEMEALQKISDSPLSECPACHEPALKKQLSAAGFRLSGSGWYETDFKKGNRKNLAGEKTCEGKGSKSCEASGSCPSA